jgi:hypothetical protein
MCSSVLVFAACSGGQRLFGFVRNVVGGIVLVIVQCAACHRNGRSGRARSESPIEHSFPERRDMPFQDVGT